LHPGTPTHAKRFPLGIEFCENGMVQMECDWRFLCLWYTMPMPTCLKTTFPSMARLAKELDIVRVVCATFNEGDDMVKLQRLLTAALLATGATALPERPKIIERELSWSAIMPRTNIRSLEPGHPGKMGDKH
jgi:hypothetical protein